MQYSCQGVGSVLPGYMLSPEGQFLPTSQTLLMEETGISPLTEAELAAYQAQEAPGSPQAVMAGPTGLLGAVLVLGLLWSQTR
jgi:hypothetical protein